MKVIKFIEKLGKLFVSIISCEKYFVNPTEPKASLWFLTSKKFGLYFIHEDASIRSSCLADLNKKIQFAQNRENMVFWCYALN